MTELEMLKSFIKSEDVLFFLFFISFVGSLAIVFYLIENTLFFEKCAVLYRRFRIRNDLYHYVRKINVYNSESSIRKTFEGLFGSVFCTSSAFISTNEYNSTSQVQSAFKVFQYSLTRLENSKEFNYFKLSSNSNDIKTKLIEEEIRSMLYDIFTVIEIVWVKEDLTSIDTTLYFNGANLSEMLKQRSEEPKLTYSDLVNSILNIPSVKEDV